MDARGAGVGRRQRLRASAYPVGSPLLPYVLRGLKGESDHEAGLDAPRQIRGLRSQVDRDEGVRAKDGETEAALVAQLDLVLLKQDARDVSVEPAVLANVEAQLVPVTQVGGAGRDDAAADLWQVAEDLLVHARHEAAGRATLARAGRHPSRSRLSCSAASGPRASPR